MTILDLDTNDDPDNDAQSDTNYSKIPKEHREERKDEDLPNIFKI